MSTEEEKQSAIATRMLGGRFLIVFLVAFGLLAYIAPTFSVTTASAPDAVRADRAHLNHAANLPEPPPTELREFSELDLEDDDDKDPDEFSRKRQRHIAARLLPTNKRLSLAGQKPSGHHNTRGARSPPPAA